eukprot:snap_masked-scaffold_6-processed-gene-11.22-mRNA-1 protein AED:0.36 eAED:0.36 QI:0/-1/0/1/-1/1/1/0/178
MGEEKKEEKKFQLPAEKTRASAVKLLDGTLKKLEVSVKIEKAVYKKFKEDSGSKEYKAKLRSLKFNLSKNQKLRDDVLNGSISSKDLVSLSADELLSTERKRKREKAEKDILDASRSDWLDANRENINKQAGIKNNGIFKCGRCKSTKTTNYQKQTRSADEPMTVFVQCTNCGNRWRF